MSLVFKYKNKKLIAGVDEVGRGSLVGPVYAAAVILNKKINKKKLKDSKKLTKEKRENLDKYINELRLENKCVSRNEVINYINNLEPSRLMYLVNYPIKQKNLKGLENKFNIYINTDTNSDTNTNSDTK